MDLLKILLTTAFLFSGISSSFSKVLEAGAGRQFINPGDALESAADGDTIIVNGGSYLGNYIINKSVVLIGKNDPVIDGKNKGTVVTIEAPNAIITGFTIQNSGILLDKEDAGILVTSSDVRIHNNHLKGVLFGIYLRKADNAVITNNIVEGKQKLDIPRRGDLFRGWYVKNLTLENNTFTYGRDVILWFSHNAVIAGNNMSGARYGLHFMYNNNCKILKNILKDNSVGMYIMYSRELIIENNLIANNRGPSGFGVGFKDLDNVELNRNVIADNRVGIFVDNSPREVDTYIRYTGNIIAYNEAGVEEQTALLHSYFRGNSFIENYTQTQLSSTQEADNDYWSGNYWSDYNGYDKDRDGTGEIPYKSAELVENLVAENPNMQIFLYSPAINALNYAAQAFPILQPNYRLIDKSPETKSMLPRNIPVLEVKKETGFITLSFVLSVTMIFLILIFIKNNKLTHSIPLNEND